MNVAKQQKILEEVCLKVELRLKLPLNGLSKTPLKTVILDRCNDVYRQKFENMLDQQSTSEPSERRILQELDAQVIVPDSDDDGTGVGSLLEAMTLQEPIERRVLDDMRASHSDDEVLSGIITDGGPHPGARPFIPDANPPVEVYVVRIFIF